MTRKLFAALCIGLFAATAMGVHVQSDGPAGLVAMEAELYDAMVPADTNEFQWVSDTEIEGYGYTGYMRTFPIGTNVTSDLTRSPRLDYDVEITQPGTLFIWARVLAPTSAENSLHLGDNGVKTADRINVPEIGEWVWKNVANDGHRAAVEVNEPGIVTINCWMRESGLCVDKLLLTSDPNYVPTGLDDRDSTAIRIQDVNDPNGVVAMEGELYDAMIAADSDEFEWVFDTELEGYSYDGYMRTFPIGTNVTSDLTRSPRLDYDVEMTQPGTFYIWARVLAPTSAENSLHLGDNGEKTADRINVPEIGVWVWKNVANNGSRAAVEVNEPNQVTINCWMRESGLCVDKLLLTSDPNYVPGDLGPRDPLVAGIPILLPVISAVPVDDMTFGVDDANNVILTSINGINTNDLVLGVTTADPAFAGVEDDFILERDYGNDLDGLTVTMFGVPVSTIFIVEKDGNDNGRFQPIDAAGNPIGVSLPFSPDQFSVAIVGVNRAGDNMSGTAITAEVPIYGIEIWATGLDPYSISAVPTQGQ